MIEGESGTERVMPPIHLARRDQRREIAAMLARAFFNDPVVCWIFPDAALRAKRLPRMFGMLFDGDAANGMRLVTPECDAATLWRAPGAARTGLSEMIRSAIPMLTIFGSGIGRALAVSAAIDAHMPSGDFWYLHIAGCDPAAQGRGLGGLAVRAGIERAADGRFPTYLECPLEKNLSFYRGLGFKVTSEWDVPRGGPRFWSMLRPATA